MTSINDFQTSSMQATIFTPGLSFMPQEILGHVLQKWGEKFNYAPISIPSPGGMPPEIPRIILQSLNHQFKVEFSPARVNSFWLLVDEKDYYPFQDFFNFSEKLLCDYRNLVKGRVGRIASVINRFVKLKNSAKFLAERFCKKKWINKPLDDLEGFEIHSHKRYKLAKIYSVNSWVRFKTGFIGERAKNERILIAQQDINTLNEEIETSNYSNEQIRNFFKKTINEFDSILSFYFPPET